MIVASGMSTNPQTDLDDENLPSNAVKDPDDWTTGDERMTGAQASYLKTLCEEAGEPFDDTLTKAAASKRIDALQQKTGRKRAPIRQTTLVSRRGRFPDSPTLR